MKHVFIILILICSSLALGEEIRMQWTDNSDNEDGFIVLRDTMGDGKDDIELDTVPASEGTGPVRYTDTTVERGKTYVYQIIAYNQAGRSKPSNRLAATARTDPVNAAPLSASDLIQLTEESNARRN